jgi:hypothetical protein
MPTGSAGKRKTGKAKFLAELEFGKEPEDCWTVWRGERERILAGSSSGSGTVEKDIEVQINRRCKLQGRSWNPLRAAQRAALREKVCLSTTKVNPGWAPNGQFTNTTWAEIRAR